MQTQKKKLAVVNLPLLHIDYVKQNTRYKIVTTQGLEQVKPPNVAGL